LGWLSTGRAAQCDLAQLRFTIACPQSLFATKRHKKLKKGSADLSFLCLFVAKLFLEVQTMIRKLKSGKYRLYSRKVDPKTKKRKNLGTFDTREAAEKHERQVQFFKRRG
jgi:hypothetical protein